MHYDYTAILDADVPQAVEPVFQHVVTTYVSEANKTQMRRPASMPSRWKRGMSRSSAKRKVNQRYRPSPALDSRLPPVRPRVRKS
jgi:hypothetical protein